MKTFVVLVLFLMAGLSFGDIQKRVLDGRDCTEKETKHFVFLKSTIINHQQRTKIISKCSGTVIGDDGNWVLTAKHCDTGVPITIKGDTWTETSNTKFVHPAADVMLIKMKDKRSPITLADAKDCKEIMDTLTSKKHVQMVLVARDTDEEKKAEKAKNEVDKVRCGKINFYKEEYIKEEGSCFIGRNFIWNDCKSCPGDSGGGVIYNSKLAGVFWGVWHPKGIEDPIAVNVCNKNVRDWIVDTMKIQKRTPVSAV